MGTRNHRLYRMSASVQPPWISFTNQGVDQYNALGGTPSTNQPPDWTYCAGNCSHIVFDVESLSSTVCGHFEDYYQGAEFLNVTISYSTVKTYGGRNGASGDCTFDSVTLHEFGHAQGLAHSCAGGAVMWAYNTSTNYLALSGDDKVGMRRIYDTGFPGPGPTSPCNGSGGQ